MVLAAVYLCLFILATPGIDSLGGLTVKDRAQALRAGTPEVMLDLYSAVVRARRPALKRLTPLQRPLRIEQSWGLYGSGQTRVRKMEVWLDDVLVYRSGDHAYDWREPLFRNRRLRPMIDTVARKPDALNRDALMWLIADRAASEQPDLSQIEVRFTVGRFPGDRLRVAHAFSMKPPNWSPERL